MPSPSIPSESRSSESRSSAATVQNVNDTTNTARLVIFPVYNSVDTRAYFGTGAHNASREARQRPTYDLSVDGHHVATFLDNQFVEIDVRPGRHSLDVTEHGWLGTTLRSATLPANVDMRQTIFIAIPSSTTEIALQTVDAHYGTEKISGREKVAIDQN
jgi:hypothetical protein